MKKIVLIIIMLLMFAENVYALDTSAQYCCMIEPHTMQIIYEKNAHERHSMASTTKIMTAVIALERCAPDEIVTVSANASRQEGSSLYLKAGEKIRMEDLLYGLMLNSGNDAAVAVAEHISGSVSVFADEMNRKAAEIGAYDTSFKNPNGLDAEGHFSTAYDMALIGAYAMKNERFRNIVGTKNKTAELVNVSQKLYFKNHNKLLNMYKYVEGIKTGYTKATGRCLVSSADIDGMEFVICTLNAPDDWNDHIKLYEYAKNEYERRKVIEKGQFLKNAYIGGTAVKVTSGSDVFVTMKKNRRFDGEVSVSLNENIGFPIEQEQKIGVCRLKNGDFTVEEFDAVAAEHIKKEERKGLKEFFKSFFAKR